MPIPFTLGKLKIEFPASWQEVTVNQYFKLLQCKKKDRLAILSALTDTDYELWKQVRPSDIDTQLAPFIAWTGEKIKWNKLPCPDTVTIEGKTHKIPKDLGLESYGQKIVLQRRITEIAEKSKKKKADLTPGIPYAFAVYLCKLHTGKEFSHELVEEFLEVVGEMPILDVYPVGNFFFFRDIQTLQKGICGTQDRVRQ